MVIGEYTKAVIIIISALVIANILHLILRKYISKFAKKTRTSVDDVIVNILIRPLYFFVLLFGVYGAVRTLSYFDPYGSIISNTFYILVVFASSLVIGRILNIAIDHWLKVQKRFQKTPQVLNRMVKVIIFILATLMVLSHFDIEVTPLIAAFGLGGLAIGLALQNTLSNFFAGLHIISDQPVKVGDFVNLPDGDVSGYVEDIGWRSTKIKTLPNTIIIIPNNKLAESIIVNNSMPEQEMAALVQCGVAYGSDLTRVEKVTIEVAKKIQQTIPGAIKTFVPFIRYHTFADSNINFTVILRVENFVDKYLVIHEFIKALKERYDKERIEISWPVRKVHYGKEK